MDQTQMRFQLNAVINDVDVLKKVYTAQKMDEIDTTVKKCKDIEYELETLAHKLENSVTKEEHEQLNCKFEAYATQQSVNILKTQMLNLVPQEDFRQLVLELSQLQKDLNKYSLIEDLTRKLNLMK